MPIVTIIRAERPRNNFSGKPFFTITKREGWPRYLFKEGLQQCGHIAKPQRIQNHQMLGFRYGCLRLLDVGRNNTMFPLRLGTHEREYKFADADAPDVMARRSSS